MIRKISVAVLMLLCVAIINTSCAKTEEATVTSVYQPLINGMVHTWLKVRFNDNSEAEVVLPDDDQIWNKARNMKGKKVKLSKHGYNWQFIGFSE